jgi:hypothetical protein
VFFNPLEVMGPVMNRQINLALTLLIAVVGLLHSAPLSAMPKAMLNPNPVAVGVSDTEIRMVLAPLRQELGRYYALITDREYNAMWERFQNEVESLEECTDDHCIRFMQDHLQVEHVFRLEMVRDGGVTQFTLNLAKLDRNLTATESCVLP